MAPTYRKGLEKSNSERCEGMIKRVLWEGFQTPCLTQSLGTWKKIDLAAQNGNVCSVAHETRKNPISNSGWEKRTAERLADLHPRVSNAQAIWAAVANHVGTGGTESASQTESSTDMTLS